jgi:hypothetical protein
MARSTDWRRAVCGSAVKPPNVLDRENSLTPRHLQGQRGARRSRAKGDRIERKIVSRHAAIGIKTERYLPNGGSRFRGGHDLDIYPFATDEGQLVSEGKSRRPDGASLLRWHDEVVTASRHDPGHSRVVA